MKKSEIPNRTKETILKDKLDKAISSNQKLKVRIKQVNDLLYSIDQGLIQFGKSLVIKDEISMKTIDLFQMDVRNCLFPNILYPDDNKNNSFLNKILPKIISEKNRNKRNILLSLLPKELKLNAKPISLTYKLIENSNSDVKFIVIIHDLSDIEEIEDKKNIEIKKLNRIINISNGYNDFMLIYNDYINFFIQEIFLIIDNSKTSNQFKILEIFRKVHTFKGSFSQFSLVTLADKLHSFESKIEKEKERLALLDSASLLQFISKYNFIGWLDSEMKEIKAILGKDYFKSDSKVTISREKVYKIHDKIKEKVSKFKAKEILPYVLDILNIPFESMFHYFQEYLVSLAVSQNKSINLPRITGGDFLIDVKKFNPFVKSLIHIFRNSISHGIENPEERELKNKNEFGNIDIFLGKNTDEMYVMIIDDGRGIDEEKIKNKLLLKNIFPKNELAKMDKYELYKQIFNDGFTTDDNPTDLSGRGMGLSSVKAEVDKLGGSVKIESNLNEGTSFIFTFPFIDLSKEKTKISTYNIVEQTVDTLKELITEELNINILEHEENFVITKTLELELSKFNAFLNITGVLKGSFVLSVDLDFAKRMTEVFLDTDDLDSITSSGESILETYESVTSEYSNIIIGNSLKKFKQVENLIEIDSPYTITSQNSIIKYPNSKVYKCDIHTDIGVIKIYFISNSDIDTFII